MQFLNYQQNQKLKQLASGISNILQIFSTFSFTCEAKILELFDMNLEKMTM